MPSTYGPLNQAGAGNQGYLFAVPAAAGRLLLYEIGRADDLADGNDVAQVALDRSPLPKTEKEALRKSRIGQGRFRDDLMKLWHGQCAISGLDVPSLLRASHIKPWSDSNNAERLSPFNGLLLSPAYDALFDAGLMTIRGGGVVVFAKAVTDQQLSLLGVSRAAKLGNSLRAEHMPFLEHHNESVFADAKMLSA